MWFGENDAPASVVITFNGNPQHLYHGAPFREAVERALSRSKTDVLLISPGSGISRVLKTVVDTMEGKMIESLEATHYPCHFLVYQDGVFFGFVFNEQSTPIVLTNRHARAMWKFYREVGSS